MMEQAINTRNNNDTKQLLPVNAGGGVDPQQIEQKFFVKGLTITNNVSDARGRAVMAAADVTCEPIHFRAYVWPEGFVDLPDMLRDEVLRNEISVVVRAAVLAKLAANWRKVDDAEAQNLADRQSRRSPA